MFNFLSQKRSFICNNLIGKDCLVLNCAAINYGDKTNLT